MASRAIPLRAVVDPRVAPVPDGAFKGLPIQSNRGTPTEPEDLLAIIVPELLRAEQTVRRFEQLMDEQRPRLAAKRGVAFIRREHVRAEFGGAR